MRPSPQWSVIASNRSNRPASCSGASYVCWQADDRCSSPYGIPTRAFAPLLSRLGGVMLSVRIANPVNEKRVIATLRAKGAADIEQAHGEWRDGDWADFNPVATTLHNTLGESKTPLQGVTPSASPPAPSPLDLDTAAIDQALSRKGSVNGGVYQVNIPRAEKIKDGGMDVPEAMGSATTINFQPMGGGKAAITGDFVLTGKEVNPVLKALRDNGIEVTALHNHKPSSALGLFQLSVRRFRWTQR